VIVLAIDTATPAVTAGVASTDGAEVRVLAERVTVNPRGHGELLMPQVTEALAEAGLTLADLDAIVCGIGPGPFTGLRVGMVTAAALAHALTVPLHGVCSLDAIAADAATDGDLLVLTDARRREVYWARYQGTHRTEGPAVALPATLDLSDADLVGEGAHRYADLLNITPRAEPRFPTVRGLVTAAALDAPPPPFIPLYLRRPDAMEPSPRKQVTPV
jgi:tRNA threonylcarbamoyl adenosine modification protein YeaZ